MKQEFDDGDLRIRFHELREEVSASTPRFAVTPVSNVKRQAIPWTLSAVGATAVVAVLFLSGVFGNGQEPMPSIDLGAVAWTAPSDFLLETPGQELLRTVQLDDMNVYKPTSYDPEGGVVDTSG